MGQVSDRGLLVVIGGRETQDDLGLSVLERFVDACGGSNARLLVLTNASPQPEEKTAQYRQVFTALGVSETTFFHHEHREQAESADVLAALDRADGVFLTGGGQLRLLETLAGTVFEERLRARYETGMPLGGSSAGASALSTMMISGRSRDRIAQFSSAYLSPGLGIFPEAIIDQHFRERKRYGRLIDAVLSNPSLLGLGLDEGTGFALDKSGCLTVLGRGVVTIIDASELQAPDAGSVTIHQPASFAGLRVHALAKGWRFYLDERRVEPAA